jgi:predicted nuclease of predicted toxin-antitoxin system
MEAIKLYTNEHITDLLARTLRGRGFDAVSVYEVDMREKSDEEQLAYAAKQRRAVLTFNVRDFVSLHTQYVTKGKEHGGIIVSTQIPFPELLRRTLSLLEALTCAIVWSG